LRLIDIQSWLTGYLAIWLVPDYLAIWLSGFLIICDYIYLATWLPWLPLAISGHLATWLSGYFGHLAICDYIFGFLAIWPSG
jgi:hypothetical protein